MRDEPPAIFVLEGFQSPNRMTLPDYGPSNGVGPKEQSSQNLT